MKFCCALSAEICCNRRRPLSLGLVVAVAALLAACSRPQRTETRPLSEAGMSYQSIEAMRALDVTDAEVAQLVKVKNAGASESTCVSLLRVVRNRNRAFRDGDAVAALRLVGMSDESVVELALVDQLGQWVGDVQPMRRAGISDPIILAMARLRAQGRLALSGPSLARLRNVGMSEETLLELAAAALTKKRSRQSWPRGAAASVTQKSCTSILHADDD